MKLFVLLSCLAACLASPMDLGAGGVYDSPMANDYYVRQFGFMFGGGRSGIFGLKALQESQDRFNVFHMPKLPEHVQDVVRQQEMVELAPVTINTKAAPTPSLFHRFMAVP